MRLAKRNLILNEWFTLILRKYNGLLRAGLRVLAFGVAQTKAQKRVFTKLANAYFQRMRDSIVQWKLNTFDNLKDYHEKLIARVLDRLVLAAMSSHKRLFLKWNKNCLYLRMKEHGDRMKAWYIV